MAIILGVINLFNFNSDKTVLNNSLLSFSIWKRLRGIHYCNELDTGYGVNRNNLKNKLIIVQCLKRFCHLVVVFFGKALVNVKVYEYISSAFMLKLKIFH